jgi:hypothetical protein
MSQDQQFQDPFEFLRRLWSPTGLPLAGMMPPLLDPNEIDKRIADLRNVEAWLNMNLNVLRMTIQGLEMQKATLNAFQGMQGAAQAASVGASPTAAAAPSAMASAAEAWWSMLQQQPSEPPAPQDKKKPK